MSTTLTRFVNKEAATLRRKLPVLNVEQSKDAVRWAINRYTGMSSIEAMLKEEKDLDAKD